MLTKILFTLALFLLILVPKAHAVSPSGQGIFIVNACNTISSPINGNTWCLIANSNPPQIYEYVGGQFVLASSTVSFITGTNNSSTGPGTNQLARFTGAPSTVTKAGTADVSDIIGVCTANCSTAGTSTIQVTGVVPCVFDGTTTAGDWVATSNTVAGDCTDAGTTRPVGVQGIGFVLVSNGSAGTNNINLSIGAYPIGANDNIKMGSLGLGGTTAPGVGSGMQIGSSATEGVNLNDVSGLLQVFGLGPTQSSGFIVTETRSPTGLSGNDILWANQFQHRWTVKNNGGPTSNLMISNEPSTFAEYAGDTLFSIGVPDQVGYLSLTNQGASLTPTNFSISPQVFNGLYRVSCYMVIVQAAGSGGSTLPACNTGWADYRTGIGQNLALTSTTTANVVGTTETGSAIINTETGTAINFSTTGYTGGSGPAMLYAIDMRVERLGG